jgi:hypothetical protein
MERQGVGVNVDALNLSLVMRELWGQGSRAVVGLLGGRSAGKSNLMDNSRAHSQLMQAYRKDTSY